MGKKYCVCQRARWLKDNTEEVVRLRDEINEVSWTNKRFIEKNCDLHKERYKIVLIVKKISVSKNII